MTKRLRVIDRESEFGLDFLEASNKAEFLQNINEFVKDLCDDTIFEIDNYDGAGLLKIKSFRDETDKEMEKRLARAKRKRDRERCYNDKLAQKVKENELAELDRLKKKYPEKTYLDDPDF